MVKLKRAYYAKNISSKYSSKRNINEYHQFSSKGQNVYLFKKDLSDIHDAIHFLKVLPSNSFKIFSRIKLNNEKSLDIINVHGKLEVSVSSKIV